MTHKKEVVIVGTLSSAARAALILQAEAIDKNIVITTVDKDPEIESVSLIPDIKIFDEAHYIKNKEPQKILTNRKARRAENSKKRIFQKHAKDIF